MIPGRASISDEFRQKLKNGFSAQQVVFLSWSSTRPGTPTKPLTLVESGAVECCSVSGLLSEAGEC